MKINEIYGFPDLVLSRDCAKPRKFDHQKFSGKKIARHGFFSSGKSIPNVCNDAVGGIAQG